MKRIDPRMTRTIGRMTIAMLVLTCIAPFISYYLANGVALGNLDGQLQRSLVVTNRAIATEIERFRYLPLVVGQDARIDALHEVAHLLGPVVQWVERHEHHRRLHCRTERVQHLARFGLSEAMLSPARLG